MNWYGWHGRGVKIPYPITACCYTKIGEGSSSLLAVQLLFSGRKRPTVAGTGRQTQKDGWNAGQMLKLLGFLYLGQGVLESG